MDKKQLLLKWWDKDDIIVFRTKENRKEFEDIIDKYGVEKVIDVAVHFYIVCGYITPYAIRVALRQKRVAELFEKLPEFSEPVQKAKFEKVRERFINEVLNKQ